jgi:hypothetical protein
VAWTKACDTISSILWAMEYPSDTFLLVLFMKITSSCLKISITRYSNYGYAHIIVTSSCLFIENMDFLFMVVTRNWFYILLTKHILVSWMLFSFRKYSQGRENTPLFILWFLAIRKKRMK